ncbi:hypothetical protein [Pedococcus bigeumensis]|uniref:Uncharacterized protein n=1 Tax=Pedococcus bigeumensis TaxID=433644 RepID=A0A502CYY4_9MICO|nr:hypothetical protein [Pedococcus bigeumensis]TPG17036.1 hypothetical protein EAH86_09680 [Pedococcus bigeumensis]
MKPGTGRSASLRRTLGTGWAHVTGFVREFFDFSGDNALPFTPGAHDVRIERGDWVYYVRAVHRGKMFGADFAPIDLCGLVLYLLLGWVVDEWLAGRPWKVGVLRRRNRSVWGRIPLLYKELVPAGRDPQSALAYLVERVNAGEFDGRKHRDRERAHAEDVR